MVKKFRNPIVAIFLALICLGIVMCTQALVGNRGNESSQYAPTVSWTDGTGTKDLLPSGVDSVRFTLSGNGYYNIFTWPYAAHTGTARVPKGLIFVVTVEGINKSNVVLFTGTKKDTANGDIMTDTIKATQVTPITPDSFSATPLCTTQVALKWKIMSANEDEFHILRAVAAATKFTDTIIVPANDTTYIDSACSPNTKYRYRIYAVNTAGNSDTSDSVSATTPDTDHTPIVTGLRPTPQSPYDTIKVGAKYLKKILYLDQDVGDVVTLSAAAPLSLSHDTISWIANDSTLGLKILTVYATDSFGKIDTFPINIYVADTSTGTKYSLTINGKLNGNWVAGRRVTISDSLTKADSVFDHWSGTDSNLVDTLTAASTIITMPAINVSLNSVYRYNDRPPVIDSVSSEPWLFDSIGVTVKMHLVYSDPDVGDPLTVTVDTPLVKLTKDTISWTPVSAGSKTLSVYVTDSHGKSDTLRWNASVPDSSTGTKYQLTVTGGTGTAKYASGTSVSIAASSLLFNHWDAGADSAKLASKTAASTSFTMPNHAATVTAILDSVRTITTDSINGHVVITGPKLFIDGETDTLTATPNANYHFVHWNNTPTDTSKKKVFTVAGNMSFSAVFELDTFLLTVNKVDSGTVVVKTAKANGYYTYGAIDTLIAKANTGYHFMGWSGDTTATADSIKLVMTKARTLTATFGIDSFTITPNTPTGGTISPSVVVHAPYGSNQTFTILADTTNGYIIDSIVTDTGKVSGASGNTFSYAFSTVKANHILHAFFKLKKLYVQNSVSDASIGTVAQPYDSVMFGGTATISFSATSPHTQIDSITVDGVKDPSFSATMNTVNYDLPNVKANHVVKAFFSKEHYTIQFTSNDTNVGNIDSAGTSTYFTKKTQPVTLDYDMLPTYVNAVANATIGAGFDSLIINGTWNPSSMWTVATSQLHVDGVNTIKAYFRSIGTKWVREDSANTSGAEFSCVVASTIDPMIVVAATGDNPSQPGQPGIWASIDSGKTWAVKLNADIAIYNVRFVDSLFWAVGKQKVGGAGIIYSSPDGLVWTGQSTIPANFVPHDVVSAKIGSNKIDVLVGDGSGGASGSSCFSTDGGLTWSFNNSIGSSFVVSSVAYTTNNGFVYGMTTGDIYSGADPTGVIAPVVNSVQNTGYQINDIVQGTNNLVAASNSTYMLQNPVAGTTWNTQFLDYNQPILGMTVQGSQFFGVTANGILSFPDQNPLPNTQYLRASSTDQKYLTRITSVGSNRVIAVGRYGVIYSSNWSE